MGLRIVDNSSSFSSFVDDIFYITDLGVSLSIGVALRKLLRDYTGSCIKVRRSSDNTLQDIGFDQYGRIDIDALQTFVGSGDGYIHTFYDQAKIDNFIQNENTRQPKIIESGMLLLENGKPTIKFTGNQILNRVNNRKSLANKSHAISFSVQASKAVADGRLLFVPTSTDKNVLRFSLAQKLGTFRSVALSNPPINAVVVSEGSVDSTLFQFTSHADWEGGVLSTSKNSNIFIENKNINQLTWPNSDALNHCSIGGQSLGYGDTINMTFGFTGSISEIVLFDTPLNAKQIKDVELSQMFYYGIK